MPHSSTTTTTTTTTTNDVLTSRHSYYIFSSLLYNFQNHTFINTHIIVLMLRMSFFLFLSLFLPVRIYETTQQQQLSGTQHNATQTSDRPPDRQTDLQTPKQTNELTNPGEKKNIRNYTQKKL